MTSPEREWLRRWARRFLLAFGCACLIVSITLATQDQLRNALQWTIVGVLAVWEGRKCLTQ